MARHWIRRILWNLVVFGVVIGAYGFYLGISPVEYLKSYVTSLLQSEPVADVSSPQTIARAGFTLQFPGNWAIDTADADYDPDHMFSIESPGWAFALFGVYANEVDPQTLIQTQLAGFHDEKFLLSNQQPITRWGSFEGEGVTFSATLPGQQEALVRFFVYSTEERSFSVLEHVYEEDLKPAKPGLDFIANSFALTPSH
jgi:hypothetical protein